MMETPLSGFNQQFPQAWVQLVLKEILVRQVLKETLDHKDQRVLLRQ
jgi:hypothetical protein